MAPIAIVSDIHGNFAALQAVAQDIQARGITQVVNLGDSLSGPLLPLQTAQWLMASGWLSLAGNHERQLLQLRAGRGSASDVYAASQLGSAEMAWLRSLPPTWRFSDAVLLCHGTPDSDVTYLLETVTAAGVRPASAAEIVARLAGERAPVVACGHTHIPRVVRTDGGQLLLNPGSVGLPAYDDVHPWPHAMETGSPHARYAVLACTEQGWQVQHRCVPYDHAGMAALAAQRGRHDWAQALRTGYVTPGH